MTQLLTDFVFIGGVVIIAYVPVLLFVLWANR